MTNTATWPLRALPGHVSRAATIVLVAIAAVTLVALAFAAGRWTDRTGSGPAPAQLGPALVAPAAPAPPCHIGGPC